MIFFRKITNDNWTYLNAEVASVYIISKEQISGGSGRSANFEQFHQIIELAVYISTHWSEIIQCLRTHRVCRYIQSTNIMTMIPLVLFIFWFPNVFQEAAHCILVNIEWTPLIIITINIIIIKIWGVWYDWLHLLFAKKMVYITIYHITFIHVYLAYSKPDW